MKYVYIAALSLAVQSLAAQTARNASMNYNDYPVYSGKDLGLTYTPDSSTFRVYAPSAESMRLLLYQAGETGRLESGGQRGFEAAVLRVPDPDSRQMV